MLKNEEIKNLVMAGNVFVLLGFFVFVGCLVVCCMYPHGPTYLLDEYRVQGKRAYRAGVSSEANPYRERSESGTLYWLEGWMEASEEEKQGARNGEKRNR